MYIKSRSFYGNGITRNNLSDHAAFLPSNTHKRGLVSGFSVLYDSQLVVCA